MTVIGNNWRLKVKRKDHRKSSDGPHRDGDNPSREEKPFKKCDWVSQIYTNRSTDSLTEGVVKLEQAIQTTYPTLVSFTTHASPHDTWHSPLPFILAMPHLLVPHASLHTNGHALAEVDTVQADF
jgi:hypothetical protein